MTIEELTLKGAELKNVLALNRVVGLRFCKSAAEIPAKAKRPLKDFNAHMAVCQGINLARSIGTTMALDLEDNFCIPGAALYGLVDFNYSFFPQHVKDEAAGCLMDAEYAERDALLPGGSVAALVISPLDRLLVEPDVIIVYGTPAQASKLAKAFTWHGEKVEAAYIGGTGCSNYVVAYCKQKPVINLPAGGERLFAGSQDHEMSIAFPVNRLDDVLDGLKGTQRILPYPTVCTTLINEPSVPPDYKITYRELG